jgi:hypothetical protein
MGVRTKAFGPFAWTFFQGVAVMFDDFVKAHRNNPCAVEQARCNLTELLFLIGFVLPCIYCRISYRTFTDPDDPDNDGLNISRMLLLEDGAKRLVYNLHDRVNQKLQDQELEASNFDEAVRRKWQRYRISYSEAVATSFCKPTEKKFWIATVMFLSYCMCDYQPAEKVMLVNFINTFGKLLLVCSRGDLHLSIFAQAFQRTRDCRTVLCRKMDTLAARIDIVWTIQKLVFASQQWDFSFTPESLESACSDNIVRKCDKKRERLLFHQSRSLTAAHK